MRAISYFFLSLVLTSAVTEVAAQEARPLPPVLTFNGQPFPETPAIADDAAVDGVRRENILFAEDWESQPAGVVTENFTNWNRVGAGAGQPCSITEVISSGGPKRGNAFRAFLEDSGTCGRAEIRLQDSIADKIVATYVGPLPVPDYSTVEWTDQFIYQTGQPANCTGTCLPDEIGYMFSVTFVKLRSDGGSVNTWQNIRPTGNHSPSPPYTTANPNWPIEVALGGIETKAKRNKTLGYTEAGGNEGNASWTILTPSDIGESDFQGETFDIYMIFRPDSRTHAEGGNGELRIYIEREGVEPTTPRFTYSGSTIQPGKYQYRSSDGHGPELGDFSLGIYHDFWQNNGISTLDSVEVRIDNIMVVKNPNVREMHVTMGLPDFSSLGW